MYNGEMKIKQLIKNEFLKKKPIRFKYQIVNLDGVF